MRTKEKIRLLKQDLIKYSKQIGIIDCEIPELVFGAKDFRKKVKPTYEKYGISKKLDFYPGGAFDDHPRGLADLYNRIVYVNLEHSNRKARTYPHLQFCLIHELVHYRFGYLTHGKKFMKRIEMILLNEKKYPSKHVTCPQSTFSHNRKNSQFDATDCGYAPVTALHIPYLPGNLSGPLQTLTSRNNYT